MRVQAQAPTPDFSATPTSGCGPLTVKFQDLSTGGPLFWAWDCGNGQISSLQNPSTVYYTPGTYTVTLIVRNTNGSNSIRKTDYITVYPYPAVSFNANLTLACAPVNIQFTNNSTAGQGSITQQTWNFGDGTTSNQPNPSHAYTATGYYSVGLTVTNSGGCTNAALLNRYIRVVPGVQTNFSWTQTSNSCSAPFAIDFINQTAGPGNLSYAWNLGNGTSSNLTNPATTYPSNTNYTVSLTAQSDLGCSQTTQQVIAFPPANPVITSPDSACTNSPVNFANGSTPAPSASLWDFGDGTGSNSPGPSKSYATAATYTVKLVNTYASCADSTTKEVVIVNNPVANFTASTSTTGCQAPFTVTFQDQTTPGASAWLWNFGDGSTSSLQNPSHTYTSTGSFNVTLTATSSVGCSNTITKPQFIQIIPPSMTLDASTVQGCINSAIHPVAIVNAVDGVASYAWSAPGATPATSTSPTPAFTYTAQGFLYDHPDHHHERRMLPYTDFYERDNSREAILQHTRHSGGHYLLRPADVIRSHSPRPPRQLRPLEHGTLGTGQQDHPFLPYPIATIISDLLQSPLTLTNSGCPQTRHHDRPGESANSRLQISTGLRRQSIPDHFYGYIHSQCNFRCDQLSMEFRRPG